MYEFNIKTMTLCHFFLKGLNKITILYIERE